MNSVKKTFLQFCLIWTIVLSIAFTVQCQQANYGVTSSLKGEVKYFQLNSKLTARQMPYRVIYPLLYESNAAKDVRYSVIYLLHGLTGHYNDWTDKSKLPEYSTNFAYIIVMPEGNNGWYSDNTAVPNDRYESYIIQELIPEIDKKFRTIPDRNHRAIAGLSMGGYGSLKFGLKYPEMFALVGSFSGALGAASFSEKNAGMIGKGIDQIFGAEDGENRKSNDIFKIIKDLPADKIKTLPFIYLDCGTEDFLFQNNRSFADLLVEKKVKHEFRQLPGAHDWKFWDAQIQEFLEVSEKFIK